MPQYTYICDPKNDGCGHKVTLECLMSELDDKKPKSCPNCSKRKTIQPLLSSPLSINIPKTLGSLADKNSAALSDGAKAELTKKFNEYRSKPGEISWIPTENGMVHKNKSN